MSRFLGEVDLRIVDDPGGLFAVINDFAFLSDSLGLVQIPAGFITDLASVPRLPFAYLVVGGKGKKAAVVHDWAYSTRFCTRKEADDLFAEALEASGYGSAVQFLMWSGVRVGGWVPWSRPNVPQEPEVAALMDALPQ